MSIRSDDSKGGACDLAFQADSFEDIAEMSKKHGMEMFQAGDEAHLTAMQQMKDLTQVER